MQTRFINFVMLLCAAFILFPAAVFADSDENQHYINQLQAKDPLERINALRTLGGKGIKATQRSTMAIVPLLHDSHESVQLAAIEALQNIEEEAKRATPDLIKLLDSRNRFIRDAAAKALLSIGSVEGIEAVEKKTHFRRDR